MSRNQIISIIVAIIIGTVTAAVVTMLTPAQPRKTAEQMHQDKMREAYQQGQRAHSFIRGAVGARPVGAEGKP